MSWDDPWPRACLALHLALADPRLGGLHLRLRAGPQRDLFLQQLDGATRIHPSMDETALFGGLDWTATLARGQITYKKGLLDAAQVLVVPMAERMRPALAARLAAWLDTRPTPVILLDEAAEPDERPPEVLTERLAFFADLNGVALADAMPGKIPTVVSGSVSDADVAAIAMTAMRLGIDSLRPSLFATRAAGLLSDETDGVALACALTLSHRATILPDPPAPEEDNPEPPESEEPRDDLVLPEELLLEAVRAALPDDLLSRLTARARRGAQGRGSGSKRKSNRRGRPLPARAGPISDRARIDLIATLRAAAPWQRIRQAETGRDGPHFRKSDLRVKRFEETSDRLLIFAVDASGSAALARLAEAKGAVELLLSQAYARRDHVSLLAFRQTEAELLLPPTRSLVQTKRRLAALPGGGGTPLAAGLELALEQADIATRRGMTPTICLLTDGRANVARDGSANRAQAAKDAEHVATALRVQGHDIIVIDTGNRPSSQLRTLAQVLDSAYLPLPRADAARMAQAVSDALATP